MDRQIRQLAFFFALAFLALVFNLTYLQIIAADKIATHPRNTRGLLKEFTIARGRIISKEGKILAKNKRVGQSYSRIYPFGELTAPIVGFNHIRYGRSGLEQSFNHYLLGRKGIFSFKEYLHQIMEEKNPGNDLILTIDLTLQQEVAKALGKRKGAVIVLDPKTGAVKALVSYPSYNPNKLSETFQRLKDDSQSPLLNRATLGLYPPGSTFKIITSAGALEEGVATPSTIYEGPKELRVSGGKVTNYADQGFGRMNFEKALAVSCNTIFAQVGLKLGGKRLVKFGQKFGLNQNLPFDLPVKKSEIPSPYEMDSLELAWTAVGQGRVLVTPLQMALATAAIANEGTMFKPYLVKEIKSFKGERVKQFKPKVLARVLSKKTAKTVANLMQKVVEEGTGKRAQISGIKVAGKTGTAEVGKRKKAHAWFVAFAPAEEPQAVVAVLVEQAGIGGRVAAPIAKQVLEAALASRE